MALVAAADHEVAEAVGQIELHDVPENGASADFDHGFRTDRALFADAGSQSTGKNHHLHVGLRSTIRAMPKAESGGRAAWQPRPHRNPVSVMIRAPLEVRRS